MNDSMIEKFFHALGADVQKLLNGVKQAELVAFAKEIHAEKKSTVDSPVAENDPAPSPAEAFVPYQNQSQEHRGF